MELYLFRHGAAEDGRPGDPDSARELISEGRANSAAVVEAVRKSGVSPSLIGTSPFTRARQTARIAAVGFHYPGELVVLQSLVPHGTPEAVWRELRDYAGEPSLLLTGHEPLLSAFAAWLLNAPQLRIDMKKSALVRIDLESVRSAPRGIFRWMVVPKLITG